ncbi:hypothetical protein EV424DRAFT_1534522 [Suillus variegatus]|nr:hypothetical protein EV424DRAFT_1534522 [Suillus variegatus]
MASRWSWRIPIATSTLTYKSDFTNPVIWLFPSVWASFAPIVHVASDRSRKSDVENCLGKKSTFTLA